jgi:energy-coupling factor transporter ATP-binding protein EcfA2
MQTTRGKSYLIVGPPGCGKSRWIRQAAAAAGHTLFRWNCRDDRALRQGRELLHGLVRTREPTWVWLEGADDITLDAQAFLRRILETASAHVTCALEVRRLECMAEPIQSRCLLKRLTLKDSPTWRQKAIHREWGQPDDPEVPDVETPTTLDQLREARLIGANPYAVMMDVCRGTPMEREVLKRSTMGMSPWILSAWVIATNKNALS